MSVVLRAAGGTDRGKVRPTNQDFYLADPPVFVVADGMGGHAAGEVAAKTAALTLAEEIKRLGKGAIGNLKALKDAVNVANATVWEKAGKDGSLHGMGTTIVALAPMDFNGSARLALVNVGDSRAYRASGDLLTRLTSDHTLVEEMVSNGEISQQQAATHPQRHILTRAVGTEPEVEIDTWELVPQTGERYLLCSDGLFNEVSETEILTVLTKTADPAKASSELINLARAHGGSDNISVVIVDVVDADAKAQPKAPPPGSAVSEPLKVGAAAAGTGAAGAAGAAGMQSAAGVPEFFNRSLDASKDRAMNPEEVLGTHMVEVSSRIKPEGQGDDADEATRRGLFSKRRQKPPSHPTPIRVAAPPGYPSSKLLTWRVGLFAAVLLAMCGAGYAAVDWYAHNSFYVASDHGQVVIYEGRPAGVLWFKPHIAERTPLTTANVAQVRVQELNTGVQEPSLKAAKAFVSRLQAESQQLSLLGQAGGQQ